MDNANILVVAPVTEKHKLLLEAATPEASFVFSSYQSVTQEDVDRADIIFGNVKPDYIKNPKNLKWLQLNSAGADPYGKPGILPSSVKLTTAVGAYGLTVSEHALSMLMSLFRRLPEYHANQSIPLWKSCGQVRSIYGSTILILGLGDIGGEFARKAKALGAYTIGIRHSLKEKPEFLDEQYPLEDLDTVLPRADAVVICMPATKDTYKLFSKERMAHMNKNCVLVNIGRGSIVDCDALYDAVKNERLYGACLDVTDPEPLPSEHPLWKCPNVIITPHVAGFFYLPETLNRIVSIVCRNIKSYFAGEELINQVQH
jgi:phosphoglycerate dehydrogenase-like enzyme